EIIPTEQGLDLSGHTQLDTGLIVLAELDPPALDKRNKLCKFGFRRKIPSQKIFNCKCRHPGSELAIHKFMHQPFVENVPVEWTELNTIDPHFDVGHNAPSAVQDFSGSGLKHIPRRYRSRFCLIRIV